MRAALRLCLFLPLMVLPGAAAEAQPGARPNFILILSEDHRADALGIEGHPLASTPNLDRLAREGTRFARAYCASPSGAAGRQAILAGRSPHSIGVTLSHSALRDGSVTLGHAFGIHGYETGFFGDPYFYSDRRHGFRRVVSSRRLIEEAFEDRRAALPPEIDAALAIQPAWRPISDPPELWLNAANLPAGIYARGMPDRLLAGEAMEFADFARGRNFVLVFTLQAPRVPFPYPADFEGRRFTADQMTPAELSAQDAERLPMAFAGLSREQKQGIMAAYFTSVAYMDSIVGFVLDETERLGIAENTVVAYLSDGGFLLGEHGIFDGRSMHEPAIRSPLILRWPGKIAAGAKIEAPVELIDLFPTLLDLAGVAAPPKLEGRSFRAALEGKSFAGRESTFCQYPENREAALREGQWKLIYASGRGRRTDGLRPPHETLGRKIELFDLAADPGETRNLAGEPAQQARVRRMLEAMTARFREARPEGFGLPAGGAPEDELDLHLIPSEMWPGDGLLVHAARERGEADLRQRPREEGGEK